MASSNSANNEIQQLIQSLPSGNSWSNHPISKYEGLWYPTSLLKFMITFQRNFQARDSDIILASAPKSGTTWTKALMYSIINRRDHLLDTTNPLHDSNPHALVPFFEFDLYMRRENPDLDSIASPRLFSTHMHYEALPDSIKHSKSKIVYICRNPLDRLVSHWNFACQNDQVPPLPIQEAFECFIEGKDSYGPIWDHILSYWKASVKNPEKILFMKYEDLKEDTNTCLKKLAEFFGCPFDDEEENKGLIEDIKKLCSIQSLSNMEVNKTGEIGINYKIKKSSLFRKGEIGDWVNYLNPTMAERFQKLMKEKMEGTGLTFETILQAHPTTTTSATSSVA